MIWNAEIWMSIYVVIVAKYNPETELSCFRRDRPESSVTSKAFFHASQQNLWRILCRNCWFSLNYGWDGALFFWACQKQFGVGGRPCSRESRWAPKRKYIVHCGVFLLLFCFIFSLTDMFAMNNVDEAIQIISIGLVAAVFLLEISRFVKAIELCNEFLKIGFSPSALL